MMLQNSFSNKIKRSSPKQLFPDGGGKAILAKQIVQIINEHEWNQYVEPFAGGASVFWQIKAEGRHERKGFVLNDINSLIVTAYRVAIAQPEELYLKLKASLYSQRLHRLSRQIINDPDGYSDIEIAWAVIYSIRTSFMNQLTGSWSRDSGANNRHRNGAKVYSYFLDYLPEVLNLLKTAIISNEDAINCIDKTDGSDTIFYCDPPYPNTESFHYLGYTQSDFEKLIDRLATTQGTVVLSCYPNDAVPKDWIKYEFPRNCFMAKKSGITSERIECVWVKPKHQKTIFCHKQSVKNQLSLFNF